VEFKFSCQLCKLWGVINNPLYYFERLIRLVMESAVENSLFCCGRFVRWNEMSASSDVEKVEVTFKPCDVAVHLGLPSSVHGLQGSCVSTSPFRDKLFTASVPIVDQDT